MAEALQKMLPYITDPGKKKKKPNDKKKNVEYVDKEVWNITGGLFPLIPSTANNQQQEEKDAKQKKWVYSQIIQKNQSISPILHWITVADKDKQFSCEKFNIKIELVKFTEEEYNQYLKNIDNTWTYEETKYLWELCNSFDLRFIIIFDRYDPKYQRTIEDLKQRFYSISRRILEVRNQQTHPLYNYKYDPEYEKIRKFELEKYLMRTKEKTEEEKNLIENLRRIEQVIRKEEKEHQTLQKMLKEQIGDEADLFEEDCVKIVQTIHEQGKKEINNPMESICYLRGKWLNEPLPIPEKMNKKLNIVLSELNVPNDFIATEVNEQLFEELRENIFIMFNYQKTFKKKELDKKSLEEKKKKILEELQLADKQLSESPKVLEKRNNPFLQDNSDKLNKKIKM